MHLSAVVRHGSRYPTVKNIRAIRQLSNLLRRADGQMGERGEGSAAWNRDVLRRWDMWYTDDMDGEYWAGGRDATQHLTQSLDFISFTFMTYPVLFCVKKNKTKQNVHQFMSVVHLINQQSINSPLEGARGPLYCNKNSVRVCVCVRVCAQINILTDFKG